MADFGVHMSHCNMGEYEGSCKYGEFDTCPALPQNRLNEEEKLIGMLVSCSPDPLVRNKAAMTLLDRKCFNAVHYLELGIEKFPKNCATLLYVISEMKMKLHFTYVETVLRHGSWEAIQHLATMVAAGQIKLPEEDYYPY